MLTAIKRILKMCGHAFTITVHDRLDTIEQRSAETDNALLQASIRIAERIPAAANVVVVEALDGAPGNPELARNQASGHWISLMVYLYSHLPSPRAALVGTPASGLATILDKAGFETITCESCAALPEDLGVLVFANPAQTQPLLGERRPAAVITATAEDFAQTVEHMRECGYYWYLVIYDDRPNARGSFFSNYPLNVPDTDGHAFFFRGRETFVEAQSWCAALLRRTFFRHRSKGTS